METIPEFEYDPAKSQANLEKHGIDFETAQVIWRDTKKVQIDARSTGERRYAMIGAIEGKVWTAFATDRPKAVRMISARRARISEVRVYEAQSNQR